jgi:hypothetical protein
MKITIQDGEKEQVFDDVLDYYIAVRQVAPLMTKESNLAREIQTKSYSKGSALRDILKELRQSVVELEVHLNGLS